MTLRFLIGSFALTCLAACQRMPATQMANPAAPNAQVATSGSAATSSSSRSASVSTAPVSSAVIRAYVDPVTGEFRAPSEQELAASNATLNVSQKTASRASASSSSPAMAPEQLPNGVVRYPLNPAAMAHEQVCVQTDGSLGECSAEQRATAPQTR